MNGSLFRDIGDLCINERQSKNTSIFVKKSMVIASTYNQTISIEADAHFQAPEYEICSHYWMPTSLITGKVYAIIAKAGLLYLIIEQTPAGT